MANNRQLTEEQQKELDITGQVRGVKPTTTERRVPKKPLQTPELTDTDKKEEIVKSTITPAPTQLSPIERFRKAQEERGITLSPENLKSSFESSEAAKRKKLEEEATKDIEPAKTQLEKQQELAETLEIDVDLRTKEELAKERATRIEETVAATKEQLEIQKKEQEVAAEQRKEEIGRTGAAFRSNFLTSRESFSFLPGVVLGEAVSEAQTAKLEGLDRSIRSYEISLEQKQKDIAEARQQGLEDVVRQRQEEIDELEVAKRKAESDAVSEQREQTLFALQLQDKKNQDILDVLGDSIADITDDELLDLVEQTGADRTTLELARRGKLGELTTLRQQQMIEKQKAAQDNVEFLIDNGIFSSLSPDQLTEFETRTGVPSGTYSNAALRIQGLEELDETERAAELSKINAQIDKFNAEANKARRDVETIEVGDDVYEYDREAGTTKKIIDGSKSASIQPTGNVETKSFAGRAVTLDTGAMASFALANQSALNAGVGEIKVGGTSTSSLRDQSATIAGMVNTWNSKNKEDIIEFNQDAPNNAAAALRNRGIRVANVGSSLHENGLALDIYPDASYIAKVKPFLTAAGWRQPLPIDDAGHFEFMGLDEKDREGFDMGLLPLYAKFNAGDFASADFKAVENLGIDLDQFKDEALASKVETDKKGANFAADIIDLATKLKTKEGKTMAAFGGDIIPFTDARDFQRAFDAFKSKLSLQNLVDLKAQGATFGALSEGELKFITDSATALDVGMSEADFASELDNIINKMTKVQSDLSGESYLDIVNSKISDPTSIYINNLGL